MFVLNSDLEEVDKQLLEDNRVERGRIEDEIRELRERNVSTGVYVSQLLQLQCMRLVSIPFRFDEMNDNI